MRKKNIQYFIKSENQAQILHKVVFGFCLMVLWFGRSSALWEFEPYLKVLSVLLYLVALFSACVMALDHEEFIFVLESLTVECLHSFSTFNIGYFSSSRRRRVSSIALMVYLEHTIDGCQCAGGKATPPNYLSVARCSSTTTHRSALPSWFLLLIFFLLSGDCTYLVWLMFGQQTGYICRGDSFWNFCSHACLGILRGTMVSVWSQDQLLAAHGMLMLTSARPSVSYVLALQCIFSSALLSLLFSWYV